MFKRKRSQTMVSTAATVPTAELVALHGGLDVVEKLLLLSSVNPGNRYIVVEALAGCGKTAMLTGLVSRIDRKSAILLLSFTKQAITVANMRVPDGLNVQTFDSLFYQTVRHGFFKEMRTEMASDEFTYENFRDLSETLSEDDLQDFVGQTSSKYNMKDVRYILVDEAQDTPPQAFRILETFRRMGKTVIITGDRHQAIFGFMLTESLFDAIPSADKVVHHLLETKRCCAHVVEFLNQRFGLQMRSAYALESGPEAIDTVCVQALYNATIGRLYAKFLFTISAVLRVKVSDGESTLKFWEAVHAETARIYSVSPIRAREIVKERQASLAKTHRLWEQTPKGWRPPEFVFSTVHHFKGGECDVTILAEDVEIQVRTDDDDGGEKERMKYVAGSRPRWGIVDMKSFGWIGHPSARKRFFRSFLECREQAHKGTAPRISSVSDLPCAIVPLIVAPSLAPWVEEFRRAVLQATPTRPCTPTLSTANKAMKAGSVADILVGWIVERNARRHQCPHVHVRSAEFQAQPTKDRKYLHMKRQGLVPPEVDAELRRIIARLKIQAAIGRYLVVFQQWNPTTSMILQAACAKSRLQSFMLCLNVLSLRPEFIDLPTRAKICLVIDEVAKEMPGVLGRPDTWVSVNIQQAIPYNSLFFFRGTYDLLIVDKDRRAHLIEVKAVRAVQPSHVLQALLYTTIVRLALGNSLTYTTSIYELNRNELCTFDTLPLLSQEALLPDLDNALYAKVLPHYYPNELSVEAIVGIL